ncbi:MULTISPECIES: hypothetical protein [Streptomyces]|nr:MULTISPECIES: hypothetical protein [Streptomyces]
MRLPNGSAYEIEKAAALVHRQRVATPVAQGAHDAAGAVTA